MSSRDGETAATWVWLPVGGLRSLVGSFNWMSRGVSCVVSGCALADGTGSTAANDALALSRASRMASEVNSANSIATADAAKTPIRILSETELRFFRSGFGDSH